MDGVGKAEANPRGPGRWGPEPDTPPTLREGKCLDGNAGFWYLAFSGTLNNNLAPASGLNVSQESVAREMHLL